MLLTKGEDERTFCLKFCTILASTGTDDLQVLQTQGYPGQEANTAYDSQGFRRNFKVFFIGLDSIRAQREILAKLNYWSSMMTPL